MFCTNCGKENDNQIKFCEHCGTELDKGNSEVMETSPEMCQLQSEEFQQQNENDNAGQSIIEQTYNQADIVARPSKKSKKGLVVRLVLMFVVIIAFSATFFYLRGITQPEAVVKACYIDMAAGNFAKAYDSIYMPEGQITASKEDFVEQWKDTGKLNISNIIVKKVTDSKTDKNMKAVTIEYMDNDTKKNKTVDVPVIKVEGKKFLIFDKWKLGTN